MVGFAMASSVLPAELRHAAESLPASARTLAEEFRLRVGRPASVRLRDKEVPLQPLSVVRAETLRAILELATGASWHAASDSVRRGFFTVAGGCRIGLCGSAVMCGGEVNSLRSLSSLCVRIPREVKGWCGSLFAELQAQGFPSAILISPPSGGKTTLLRELCRLISDAGRRVSLCDERGEVAAVWKGVPQFDVGMCTDVLTGAPKAVACMMLLRSMAPDVLALDEITAPEDVLACETASNCGVSLLATAHGNGVDDLFSRGIYRMLLEKRLFRLAVTITAENGVRRLKTEALP